MMKNLISKLKNMSAPGRALVLVSAMALIKFYPKEVVNFYVLGLYLFLGLMAYHFVGKLNFTKEVEQSK
ncbi:hypothetical protein [Noviherbaspirillum sp. ST 5-3]|uniref:hypothetical protein n=1 Tax=Noviherbaspirillum sp. ST 5-3 TaxID=3349878 RepID=UPI00391724F7